MNHTDCLIVKGGAQLNGEVKISGAKNAVLPIMACALLSDRVVCITNVPKLTDVNTMIQLLKNHGAVVNIIDKGDCFTISIDCCNISNFIANYDIVSKMRASIWVLGPLLARFGRAKVSFPGGCAIGVRQIDLHIDVFEAMGATIQVRNGYIYAKTAKLKGTEFRFKKVSVGATINAIMAATLAHGETILANCAQEPEIIELCKCLKLMGANIYGIGTNTIKIVGVNYLNAVNYCIIPDRIEAGTYMIAAAITKGSIDIIGIEYKLIESLIIKLMQAGLSVTIYSDKISVRYVNELRAVDIETHSYPGFPTDLQAQFMSLMTISNGISSITENIYDNRFTHVQELCRMGANIKIDKNVALVHGVPHLTNTIVRAHNLRAAVSLVLASLATARGHTKITHIYHLDRGYQSLEQKLTNCGASIIRVKHERHNVSILKRYHIC